MRISRTILGLALTLLVAAAVAAAPGRGDAAVKCAPGTPVLFPDAPDFVTVVDGKPAPRDLFERLDPKSIVSIAILCPDALYQRFSVKARLSGTVVVTTAAPPPPAPKPSTDHGSSIH